MNKKYTAIDLFAGCGGFSQGFLKAGFEILAASEIWDPAVLSYRYNHEDVRIIEGDITSSEIKKELYQAIDGTSVNVIIGGPPCQGYSIAGNRNPNDPRGQLYLDFVDYHKNLIKLINDKIYKIKNDQPIYLFGAHVFSQYLIEFGLNTDRIVCLLDNDKNKQGKRLYGSSMMVNSPKVLAEVNNPIVILKAAVYNQEIKDDILKNINSAVTFLE